jgi:protocatechuate 3,4-dioxygenase beta subunit
MKKIISNELLSTTIIFIILLNFNKLSVADYSIPPEIILKNTALITPEIVDHNNETPEDFTKTNNLRRKSGSPFFAHGKPLIIEGYVLDMLDTPLENVSIKIWQNNAFGYPNTYYIKSLDEKKYDIDFSGTGLTYTDNLGYYRFFTILPGTIDINNAPKINFIIESEEFETLQTVMFFENHQNNISDKIYKSLNVNKRPLVTCSIIDASDEYNKCLFNIKINTIHPRKKY